jgi:hypothetical protein
MVKITLEARFSFSLFKVQTTLFLLQIHPMRIEVLFLGPKKGFIPEFKPGEYIVGSFHICSKLLSKI